MRPRGMPTHKLDGSSLRRGPSASSLPTEPVRPPTVVRPKRRQPAAGGFLAGFWKWCKYLKRWFKSLLGWACIIVVLANGASGQFLEQLTKVAGSIARVTESMSLAAASAIDHGTGLAASTSSAVLAFSTGAVGLAQTAWQGVDLLDLHCVKTTGTITAAHNQALIDWLRGPFSGALLGSNDSVILGLWEALVQSVHLHLPQLQISQTRLDVHGSFWQVRGRCAIHHAGFLLLDFEYTEVRFAARWANPFWEALQLDIDSQYDQIYSLVDNFSSAVVANESRAWYWVHQDLPPPGLMAHLWFWSVMVFRAFYLHMVTFWGVGFMTATFFIFIHRHSLLQQGTAFHTDLLRRWRGWELISSWLVHSSKGWVIFDQCDRFTGFANFRVSCRSTIDAGFLVWRPLGSLADLLQWIHLVSAQKVRYSELWSEQSWGFCCHEHV